MIDNLDIQTILGLATYMLNYDERFLDFRKDIGEAKVKAVRDLLVGALEDNLLAAQAAEKEWEEDQNQEDEAFSVIEKKGEKILVMNVWRHNKEENKDYMDSMPLLSPDIVAATSTLKEHLLNGGGPLPFDNTISLVLSSALMIPLGYGLLDYFGFGIKDLIGVEYSSIDPNFISSLLLYILNLNVVALDLHEYFTKPFSIRDILPLWSTDKDPFKNTMYFEWECPAELEDDGLPDGSGKFVCSGSTTEVTDTLVDSSHFQSLPEGYPIDADGHPLKSPYIAWRDPTFGNILYLNIKKLKLEGYPTEPKWQKADQLSVNAAFGKILAGVLKFVSKNK